MADRSKIEWCDATWNPIAGCSRVSEGCRNCFAEGFAARGLPGFKSLAHFVDRPDGTREARWTGAVTVREHLMEKPLHWRRPRRIFVNSMSDLFHDAVPDEVIDRIFEIMAGETRHTFLILTKRPERMRRYMARWQSCGERMGWHTPNGSKPTSYGGDAIHIIPSDRWPLPNVWLGVSVEDQVTADVRVPYLLDTPAAIRFASYEPALGPIDWRNLRRYNSAGKPWIDGLRGLVTRGQYLARSPSECCIATSTTIPGELPGLDQIIMGGESGPRARPMHPDWARQTRDQCAAAGVAFLFKQWGEWAPRRQARKDDLVDARKSLILSLDRRTSSGLSPYLDDAWIVDRVGKRAAGRLLDGVEHNGMPEVRCG